ncbi:MAG TPA: flagellar biosynthetic protein FliO, partial [Tissierellaceae bacterium]|nr:flagellar biosynthetic protein FliO [Tissierellaceae bacterium]
LIKTLFLLILVIILAHLSLRALNKYMSKDGRLIRVIERVPVGNNSYLAIVEICDSYYLMSLTPKDNRLLKELNKKDLENQLSKLELDRINATNISFLKEGRRLIDSKISKWNEGKN